MDLLLAPESRPFAVAFALLLALALIEGAGLLLGVSMTAWMDNQLPESAGADYDSLPDSWLGWLHVGRVPLLVLLALLLTAFAVIGLTGGAVIHGLFGFYPPALFSVPVAFLGALPVVHLAGAAIARLVPSDETSAVPLSSLVGRIAVVVNGTARCGHPAQARTRNEAGQTFYVHVEPDSEGSEFIAGDAVLLVSQISGTRFHAIPNPRPDLL
ncbi:MAG: YqiJ family protein [Betaproteobacteria bacterium]|nr:YqiJ family protein [Betaproteobacteria bacterium]